MPRVRQFRDAASGRGWSTRCDGSAVETVSGMPGGRERRIVKTLANTEEARGYALKKEWERLRAGFVLSSPSAKAGEPLLHRYLDNAYTGAIVIEKLDDDLLCSRFESTSPDGTYSNLSRVTAHGAITDSVLVPGLAWQARYIPELRRIIVLADHQIYGGTVPFGGLEPLTARNPHPASFLSCAGTRAAWYAEPDIVVTDLRSGAELFRETVPAELYGGHSLQMEGALSRDGALLASCSHPGKIVARAVADGQVHHAWTADFGMVSRLMFTPDGRSLIAREQYGNWRWHRFDLADGSHDADWLAPWDSRRSDLAIDREGRRAALMHGTEIVVFDLATLQRLVRFPVDHAVRQCALTWAEDLIAVLTDAGVVSLYASGSIRRDLAAP